MLDILMAILLVVTLWKVWPIMSELERLRAEVAENGSAIDSAVTLISGLANRIREAMMSENMETELSNLADELDANSNRLATAVAENSAAAEDSDDVYDPTPIGDDGSTDTTESGEELGTEESDDTGAGVDEELAEAEEQVTGDTDSLPTAGDVAENSEMERAGEGVTGTDSATDTSANTDEPPIYGNGDGSAESASAEGTNTDNADDTDSSDENGNAAA